MDIESTGSTVIKVLEDIWTALRAEHSELPDVVMVTGTGMIGPPRWGHHKGNVWSLSDTDGDAVGAEIGEMFISGESLHKGGRHALETMLHEATHVLAGVRGVQDTSRQGRWHNRAFVKIAEEFGLEYGEEAAHPKVGFSEVRLAPGSLDDYTPMIEELDSAIRLTVPAPESGMKRVAAEGESKGGALKATCGCEVPRTIRLSKKVMSGGAILCGECQEEFMVREEE